MSNIPAELRYSEDHEWISTSAPWKIGVSDYAQNALGDLTYVELPSVGDTFEKGQEFGTLESTKSVSPLFMPVAGRPVIPNCRAIAAAVVAWSPVIMRTRIPASLQSAMASLASFRGGSTIPTKATSVRSFT